jgi:hypothetical protein
MKYIKLSLSILLMVMSEISLAQVKQNVIVEHFTNTNCSVCGSRNPGFYTNLGQHPEVRHIAYHPSAPYASCFFSKQNKVENDDRTKYYGVFGGTPRLVIQGSVIASTANYSASSLFDPFLAKTTPVQIDLWLHAQGKDSLEVLVSITNKAAHTIGDTRLFLALVEKEISFNAPNGENVHHDVFRKSFFATNGMPFTLSGSLGDSIVYAASILKDAAWKDNQLYAVAILNKESDKALVQTENSNLLSIANGLENIESGSFEVFPNPSSSEVNISLKSSSTLELKLIDITGKIVLSRTDFRGGSIDLSGLTKGVYFIQIGEDEKWSTRKIIKQ